MVKHKFNYKWNLSNGYPAKNIRKHNNIVFGAFLCGGGSTMGYKLAGYDHIGGIEVDKKIAEIYKINHNPKYFYHIDIRDFNKLNNLPKILYHLDLLDGSPPCSSFSIAGNREKDWMKEKKFREGQKKQFLDDLIFHYCNTIIKLKPKCFLLENVKGIILGNAKIYSKKIKDILTNNGYIVQVYLLNAATMGVPQKRERVFFIGHKIEYSLPKLNLCFNESPIVFKYFRDKKGLLKSSSKLDQLLKYRISTDFTLSDINKRLYNKLTGFNSTILHDDRIPNTIPAGGTHYRYYDGCRLTDNDIISIGSFPLDYNFMNYNKQYLIGMSVPPIMMANISYQIYLQWLSKMD